MVLVAVPGVAGAGVEEEVAGDELEKHARGAPIVGGLVPLRADDYLGGAVLPRLDVIRHLLVGSAAVAEVCQLREDLLQQKGLKSLPLPHRRHRRAAGLRRRLIRVLLIVPGLGRRGRSRWCLLLFVRRCPCALILRLRVFLLLLHLRALFLALGQALQAGAGLCVRAVRTASFLDKLTQVMSLNEDVFQLDVRVDDASGVDVSKTHEGVSREALHHRQG
mmetsp:Transcript_75189/g.244479  ORF Transcript_75189/g.244479 Transcript_75189/m.244479 type:complete len:220 (+) Transcript_75189:621-1280(+)